MARHAAVRGQTRGQGAAIRGLVQTRGAAVKGEREGTCRHKKESANRHAAMKGRARIDVPLQGNPNECEWGWAQGAVTSGHDAGELATLEGTFPEIFTWPNQNQSEDDTTSNKINHAPWPIHLSSYPNLEKLFHLHFEAHIV